MKYSIIFLLLVSSCGIFKSKKERDYDRVKKYSDKIQEILVKRPDLADTFKLVKHDTVFVDGVEKKLEASNDVAGWDNTMFGEVDSLAKNLLNAPLTIGDGTFHSDGTLLFAKPQAAKALQNKICPAISDSSTAFVRAYNSEFSLMIPIHYSAIAKNGKIKFSINVPDIKLPERRMEQVPVFRPVIQKFYQDTWFWVAVVAVSVLVLFVIFTMRRK